MKHPFADKSRDVVKPLVEILASVCHYIHPEIVERIVKENVLFRDEFVSYCGNEELGNIYFYDGSDCVFPGTRRCISSEKNGEWKNRIYADNTILNDNTYPRYIWSYLCSGHGYSGGKEGVYLKCGLNNFELSHVFSHKTNERKTERESFRNFDEDLKPYSLFSSAGNVLLIPKWLPKPTDKSDDIKRVFYKRHIELYGDISKLPGLSSFREEILPEWYNLIKWSSPDLPHEWENSIKKLLKYRAKYLRGRYRKIGNKC